MIERDLVAAISPLVGGRVFPDTAPAATPRPFVIYQQVGGRPSVVLAGNTRRANARFQFTVWCEPQPTGGGRAQASTLMRAIEAALSGAPLRGVSQGGLAATYDEATRTYGARWDCSFWHDAQG